MYLIPGKDVTILANKSSTCDKIRSEFIECASNNPTLLDKLQTKSSDARKLAQEISKQKLHLKDGTEVIMQSAGSSVSPNRFRWTRRQSKYTG